MAETIKLSRTVTYEHAVNGLLTKRADLFNEAIRLRDRLAEIRNDIGAVDRVLGTLGHEGNFDAVMPRSKREVLFARGELSRAILDELRDAPVPLGTREIAQAVLAISGKDARDRKLIADLTHRVGKALRALKADGLVKLRDDRRLNQRWSL